MLNTKSTLYPLLPILAALALLGQGCPTPQQAMPPREDAMQKEERAMEKDSLQAEETVMPKEEGAMKKTESVMEQAAASTYEPFTKAKYDAARSANKPVLLFFYANWCPFCKEQDPRFARVIPAHDGGVVALRVNYNDTETDGDEKALAREFGVTYQHTMFFIGRDGQTKKKSIGTLTDAQTLEYLDLISK